ncbi:MAG: hypothetical protein IJX25_04860 [Clostridia bacterium]|nr:hypothetical protein [Clostridia bacterium]MBQ8792952.1 hypothetical protein [Clostridia bacterium]
MEKQKMSATKKLTIAVCSLAVALCVVAGGLIGVWAATQQSVNTTFNVQYSVGQHIAARVSAAYQVGTQDTVATAAETSMGEISFDTTAAEHESATDYHQITGSTINLTPDKTYVLFTYTFENTSASTKFTATLTDTSMASNVTVKYNNDESKVVNATSTEAAELAQTNVVSVTVEAGQTVEVEVLVNVYNVNNTTASYVSNTTNGVLWALAYTA